MAQCRHNHTPLKVADKWTKVAMVGEGVASFVSDGYWLGGIIDLAFSLEDNGLGLSWYGIGFGAGLSLVVAAGTAYSHTMLNISHQDDEAITNERSALLVNAQHDGHHDEHNDHHSHSHHDHAEHDHPSIEADGRLNFLQKLALAGDFISHTGDIAGPITFVAKIAAQERLPIWGTILTQCGAALFGGLSSVANVRTCAKSMRARNQQNQQNQQNQESQAVAQQVPQI